MLLRTPAAPASATWDGNGSILNRRRFGGGVAEGGGAMVPWLPPWATWRIPEDHALAS